MMGMSAATCWFESTLALGPRKLMLRLRHPTILGSIVAVIGIDVLSRAIQMWSVEPRLGGGAALHATIGFGSYFSLLRLYGSLVVRMADLRHFPMSRALALMFCFGDLWLGIVLI